MILGLLVNMENRIAMYSYATPWALFPQKWCVAPEFFVLISSHCSTQIWRIRYGGSWSIYFLVVTKSYYSINYLSPQFSWVYTGYLYTNYALFYPPMLGLYFMLGRKISVYRVTQISIIIGCTLHNLGFSINIKTSMYRF